MTRRPTALRRLDLRGTIGPHDCGVGDGIDRGVSKAVRRTPSFAAALLVTLACSNNNPPEQDSADGTGGIDSVSADGTASASGGATSTAGTDSAEGTTATVVTGTAASDSATGGETGTETDAGSGSGSDSDVTGDGSSSTGEPVDSAESSGAGGSTGLDSCGGQEYDTEQVPPNVLILLDRSNSMTTALGGSTRWDVALAAVRSLTENYESQINFGLALYPGVGPRCSGYTPTNGCPVGEVFYVDPAPSNAAAIDEFLDDARYCSGDYRFLYTPTDAAIAAVADYEPLEDPTRNNFLVVVTDGQAQCGGTSAANARDAVPAILELRAQEPEIQTFVVGFSRDADRDQLTAMAEAGGRARDGDPNYYQADDAAALEEAFAAIAGSVVSCDFSLSERPLDPNLLYIYIDGESIAPGSEDGWRYEEEGNIVRFFGASCDLLQSGSAELRVVFGCPLPS